MRKQREEFAEARSYKSREAATRRIDETNPSQLSIMLFAHSWKIDPFHSFVEPRSFSSPLLPSLRFARTLIGGRAIDTNRANYSRVPLPLRIAPIDTNRKVAGEWRGGEKFDSLVIRCQVERISMTRNGQCFSTVFFKSCFNETIVKRMWREWRINEGGEGKNRYLIWSRVIDFTKVIFLLIHFASIIDRSYI